MTIRGKLLGMAVVVLVVIATMAGVTYYRGASMMRDRVDRAGMEIVRGAAGNIDGLCNTVAGVVRAAADSVRHAYSQLDVRDEDGIERILSSVLRSAAESGVSDIYMGYEATGKLSDGLGWKEPADYDARTRPWYREAVAAGKGKVIFTDPYVSQITKKLVVSVATALYEDGALLGVLTGDMDIAGSNESIANLRIFGKGYGMLLLRDGTVAAGPEKDDILRANLAKDEKFPETLRSVAKKMISGEAGFETYAYRGEEKQMFYAPTQRGFFLGIQYPVSEIASTVRGLTTILLVIAAVALVVTGGVIFVIARGLTKSIDSMERVTEKLGAGDLTVKYDDSGKDEIAHISQILNAMVASLRDVMTSIRKESEETARRAETLASLSEETLSSMEEVSGSIEKVREMMEHSSAALEEANASIEEIASSAQSVAKTSGDGAENAARASASAGTSVKEVDEVIGNIRNAAGESAKSIDRIKALAKSVEDISGFVTTITSIADQTNLLALNAAIEAARAGEAGRGFAVVAEEVRKLAEESARAANEVNKLIDGLQRHSGDSISATENTGRILNETMKRAAETQEKLKGAVSEIARVADAVQSIAAVSEEQAASSEEMSSAIQSVTASAGEVVESVDSIRSASVETTKAAEGIATEAQDMAATAEKLQKLVGRFVLGDAVPNGLVPKK